jgi:acetyl esterase
MKQNKAFGNQTLKLYRTLEQLIRPAISRKNITDYKIILSDGLVPVRVFYPSINVDNEKVIVFIHGEIFYEDETYSALCKELALKSNCMVLAIDYNDYSNSFNDCYKVVKHIYKHLKKISISDIYLMGDSIAVDIATRILSKLEKEKINVENQIMLYPVLEEKDYSFGNNCPKTLVITADLDPLKKDGEEIYKKITKVNKDSIYHNIKNVTHGFLNNPINSKREDCFEIICNFVK